MKKDAQKLLEQYQDFDGLRYRVGELVIASTGLEPFDLNVRDIYTGYEQPNENSLTSFIQHCQRTLEADMDYPIILSPCNFILDGKHRLAKAILENRKTIKAVRFETMPRIGEQIEE